MLEIKCDSYQLSEVPTIDAFNSRDDFYEYEDAVRCRYTVAQGSDCTRYAQGPRCHIPRDFDNFLEDFTRLTQEFVIRQAFNH